MVIVLLLQLGGVLWDSAHPSTSYTSGIEEEAPGVALAHTIIKAEQKLRLVVWEQTDKVSYELLTYPADNNTVTLHEGAIVTKGIDFASGIDPLAYGSSWQDSIHNACWQYLSATEGQVALVSLTSQAEPRVGATLLEPSADCRLALGLD